uniref:Uncharacterized protein n=1 Tax=Picea glauca TaxID=3330 RepID=A0A101LZ38_PICGL|nr:hypothetical protein ABT39_MTgene4857 [Picea glauca]QHR88648.1 hypothetical protein Q903MT_gene2662 [Picea sitchensis]
MLRAVWSSLLTHPLRTYLAFWMYQLDQLCWLVASMLQTKPNGRKKMRPHMLVLCL